MATRAKRKTTPRARSVKQAKKRAAAPRRRRVPEHLHGTEAGYRLGCRDPRCTAAASAAARARRERRKRNLSLDHLQRELRALQETEAVPGKRVPVPEQLYRAYVEARTLADEAERALLAAELELKQAIGDGETFTVNGRNVGTWGTFTRTFFDTAAFRKGHPAMWEKYQRSSSTRRFIPTMFAATPPQRRARALVRKQPR